MNRPTFSIVVRCYGNASHLDYLLDTCTQQYINKDDFEIILHNVNTTVYNSTINKYKSQFNIIVDSSLKLVRGKWITFIDESTALFGSALKDVKKYIKRHNPEYMISINTQVSIIGKEEDTMCDNDELENDIHGKFFNKDKMWDKFGSSIAKRSDKYIMNACNILEELTKIKIDTDLNTYFCLERIEEDAIKEIDYDNLVRDYVIDNYILREKYYESDDYSVNGYVTSSILIVTVCYFYIQKLKFIKKHKVEDDIILARILQKLKNKFEFVTYDNIINVLLSNDAKQFNTCRDIGYSVGGFVPEESIFDYFRYLIDMELAPYNNVLD